MAKTDTLSAFAEKAGISIGYASGLLTKDPDKRRQPTVRMAIEIFEKTGRKIGILDGATRAETATLLRMARRTGLVDAEG